MSNNREIIAFVHIGKAGGTTLIHILRRNYFLRSCDVRPLAKASDGVFCADDLRKTLRTNPFVKCIMGHSIRAYSDLTVYAPRLRYITILRDPISRCISQYQQRVDKYGKIGFDTFLTRDWLPNLQTRFIAGSPDLSKAKEMLESRFYLVGILEEFDAFLTILSRKLQSDHFDPSYRVMRASKDANLKNEILEKYKDRIAELHELDLQLYEYAKTTLLRQQKSAYGPSFDVDLAAHKQRNESWISPRSKPAIDYVVRKFYYEPLTGLIRVMNGLPAKGLR